MKLKNRDFVMARLGVVASRLNDGRDMSLSALQVFADGDNSELSELLSDAMMCCHEAATALGLAQARLDEMHPEELEIDENQLSPAEDSEE